MATYTGPSEIDPVHIIFNEQTDKIGEGKFGTVYRGRCHESLVAIKVPKRQNLSARDLEKFRREVLIMRY
jgi:serine/threonine protein kinase